MEDTIRTSTKVVPGECLRIIRTLSDGTKIEELCKFHQVSRETASRMRLKDVPYCIMRLEGKIYIAILPKEFSEHSLGIRDDELMHRCDKCRFCHAISSAEGGCDKVADRLLESLTALTLKKIKTDFIYKKKEEREKASKRYVSYVKESKRLEKYPFISFGLETVHTTNDLFIVSDCKRFLADAPRAFKPPVSSEEDIRKISISFRNLYPTIFP